MTITPSAQDQLNQLLNSGECLEIGLKGGGCNGLMITLEKMTSTGTTELSNWREYQIRRQDIASIFTRRVILTMRIRDSLKDL